MLKIKVIIQYILIILILCNYTCIVKASDVDKDTSSFGNYSGSESSFKEDTDKLEYMDIITMLQNSNDSVQVLDLETIFANRVITTGTGLSSTGENSSQSENSTGASSNSNADSNAISKLTESASIPDIDINDTSVDSFFKNTVFAGDSIMYGFENYCEGKDSSFMGDPTFFAHGSYAIWHALEDLETTSQDVKDVTPTYNGELMHIEDVAAEVGAEKIFIFLGSNDIGNEGAEAALNYYRTLINNIREKSPNIQIYLMSTISLMSSSYEKGTFTAANMKTFNDGVYSFCQEEDYLNYIDVRNKLIDSEGWLKSEYCGDPGLSDGGTKGGMGIHLNSDAYDVWVKVLKAYAQAYTGTFDTSSYEVTSPRTVGGTGGSTTLSSSTFFDSAVETLESAATAFVDTVTDTATAVVDTAGNLIDSAIDFVTGLFS